MKENIIKHTNNFLVASHDNDMIGMLVSIVNFMIYLRKNYTIDHYDVILHPNNYYKFEPHIPKQEVVHNARNLITSLVKDSNDDVDVWVKNIYTVLVGIAFTYNMPVEAMNTYSVLGVEVNRVDGRNTLIRDGMSENWIQEPSNNDYTEFLL